MSIKITAPSNLAQFQLGDLVSFQGNADTSIDKVELFAEQYKLSETTVIDAKWSTFYSFNGAGKRRIIAKGFNTANREIDRAAIDIWLVDGNLPVLGIDVSNNNPPVNWQAVKDAKISFAFAKATEGATYKDSTFATNWSGMKAAGIMRGAYHFFRPAKSPEDQVRNFLQAIQNVYEPGDLPPVLDVEPWPDDPVGKQWRELTVTQRIERVKTWLKEIEQATGEKPIIYTNPSFWQDYMSNSEEFTQHPLWIAHYTGRPQPDVPANNWGGKGFTFWQHTESGTVTGVSGPVDRNKYQGTLDRLVALASSAMLA